MGIAISMVALDKNAKISGGGITKSWASRWPGSPAPTNSQKKENTLAYDVGEYSIIYGLMPAPIPWSDLEWPCANSTLWPEAAAAMKQHKRHVIVTATGDGDAIERMKLLTQATTALMDACEGVIGVYWGTSSLVLPPKTFNEIACESLPDGIPLAIWVNCFIREKDDGTSAGFTRGMAAFDKMEFECANCPEPPQELLGRLFGLSQYVLEQGAVIKNGDTIGQTAEEKIRITYEKSEFGLDGKVMRLAYPAEDRKIGGITTYGIVHAVCTLLCTIGFGYFLYTAVPILRGSFARHFLFIPATIVFGFFLLLISDKILNKLFGWEAFAETAE